MTTPTRPFEGMTVSLKQAIEASSRLSAATGHAVAALGELAFADRWARTFAGPVTVEAERSDSLLDSRPPAPSRRRRETSRQYRARRRQWGRDVRAWKRAGCPPTRVVELRMSARVHDGRSWGLVRVVSEDLMRDDDHSRLILKAMRHHLLAGAEAHLAGEAVA